MKLGNLLFSVNGYNPIIPNQLKKYFNEKIIDNSYLRKLSILLHSNDKNYEQKRNIINKLNYAIDSNNREYLTKIKFKFFSDNSNSTIDNKTIENHSMIQNQRINYDLSYFREPKVIIHNEKIMMDIFKKKNKLFDKLPYLSRSTNDLINYNYKKDKDKSNISKNWMSSNNNYLNIIPKLKKIRLKRIHLSPQRTIIPDKKDLKIRSSLSVKNLEAKKSENNTINTNVNNKTLDLREEEYKNSANSIIYEDEITRKNKLKEEQKKRFLEKYNRLRQLSNKEVLNEIGNSIEIPIIDLEKGMFPGLMKRNNENKIEFLFGKHLPEIK